MDFFTQKIPIFSSRKLKMMLGKCFLCATAVLLLFTVSVAAESRAQLREKVCRSNSDCVTVLSGTGQLLIDELDFEKDTAAGVLKRLPSWFGPQRPVEFVFNGKKLDDSTVLAKYGIPLGGKLTVVAAVKPTNSEL